MNLNRSKKTPMPLPLVNSEEELVALQKHRPKRGPRGGMVVVVDGQNCVQIPLTQGKFTLIDAVDYSLVGHLRWFAAKSHQDGNLWYAARTPYPAKKYTTMHAMLFGYPPCLLDHKNGDGLDNRRCNLRPATPSQNNRNGRFRKHNTSGFRGVSFSKRNGKWSARIKGNHGKSLWLGYHSTAEAAGSAYDAAAKEIAGEFARLNNYGPNASPTHRLDRKRNSPS